MSFANNPIKFLKLSVHVIPLIKILFFLKEHDNVLGKGIIKKQVILRY